MQKKHLRVLSFVIFLFLLVVACNNAPEAPIESPSETSGLEDTAAVIDVDDGEADEVVGDAEVLLVPQGEFRESYYAPIFVPIALDGDLADWEGVPMVKLPDPPSEVVGRDTTITFAAAADETYLYMMANVFDRTIVTGEHGDNYWNEDSVEFYINGTGDFALTDYKDGVAQINIPPINIGRSSEEMIFSGIQNETSGIRAIVVEVENGYVIEAAIPLENNVWNINAEHGEVIGFQVHLNGSSGGIVTRRLSGRPQMQMTPPI